eukprot:124437-Amphidinium_carterae.1
MFMWVKLFKYLCLVLPSAPILGGSKSQCMQSICKFIQQSLLLEVTSGLSSLDAWMWAWGT